MRKNIIFKKIYAIIFIFIISFPFVIRVSFAQSSEVFAGQAVQSIEGLSDPKQGLMTCDPYSEDKGEQCTPKDAVDLIKKLGSVALYIIMIALFVMLIIGGLGYVYYGKSPEYLKKWKRYIQNALVAILIIIGVFGLMLGILTALGMDEQILGFLKQILAQSDLTFFSHAYAQEIPAPAPGPDGEYTNFFPRETIGSLILKIIEVLIKYIVAPALVLATIWSGFLFVKAEGNPQKLTEAKKFATRVVIGILITAAAAFVVTVILNSLNEVADIVNSGTNNN